MLEALHHQDVELAQMVIADDDRVDGRYLEVHQGILSLLALQAPVAGDLRLVAALLHMIKHIERMGDQCVNIAKLIPLSGYEPPVHREMLDALAKMGAFARSEVVQSKAAFAARDVALAEDLVRQDREINRLNREIFRLAIEIGDDPDTREWAMHMTLVARALERIGDNAVDIGEQVAFVVTGLFREFSDSSRAPARLPLPCGCSMPGTPRRPAESVPPVKILLHRLAKLSRAGAIAYTAPAMSASVSAEEAGGASAAPDAAVPRRASLRIAVLDRDSGFIQVLSKRLDRLGWEHRVLASPVPAEAVVSMRLSALVVDLAVLGPQAWGWLERLCEALPELGIVVCTGPSTVAQRVRGLRLGADDWITKPCHPEEVIARVQSVVRRRRRSASRAEAEPIIAGEVEIRSDRFQAFVGEQQHRPDQARVRADRAARRRRGPRARARGDLLAPVGLHDGARRPLGRRVRAQAAPEAREGLARAGATSTRTSASATASRPNRSRSSTRAPCPRHSPPSGMLAIRASSRGRRRATSSPPAPSSRTTARPPFLMSTRAPVSSPTTRERSGSWPTSSRRPSARTRANRVERLRRVEAAASGA